jgi:hypothetical protein
VGGPLHKSAATSRNQELRHAATFRRFALGLAAFLVIPPLLLAGFIIVVDPYYVFGSPSWPGINRVRPLYEPHVITAKPYQVERIQPEAVILGSSRAEVGLDPGHSGWGTGSVFDFGLPASTEYEVMRAFLHAQAVARPLKRAVVGLDFFAFNIFFPRSAEQQTLQFTGDGTEEFAKFLDAELASRSSGNAQVRTIPAKPLEPSATSTRRTQDSAQQHPWNEALYLAVNPDVAAAIKRGEFNSGFEHYQLAGRAERRLGGWVPSSWNETRYLKIYPDVAAAVARGEFLSGYHHYLMAGRAEGRSDGSIPSNWNEALYLRVNPDVSNEIKRGTFLDGYHHYLVAGRAEGRVGGLTPVNWDEVGYVQVNPDVAAQIQRGVFLSGYHHYLIYGRFEGRQGGFQPADWNEAGYLGANPEVRVEVALGAFRSGYIHYLIIGQKLGLVGGFPASDLVERLEMCWPWLNRMVRRAKDKLYLVFSTTAVSDSVATILRQSEPAAFDTKGVRLFNGQDDALRQKGGVGSVIRIRLGGGGWGPWLWEPKLMYCFTNSETGMTMFDPFRFMVRRAYAEGTDLRLFTSPLPAIDRALLDALGIGTRYDFWLRELVSINEEEAARAGKPPLPLWDFSNPNSITTEPVPKIGDPSPMHWYWEYSHYRRATGDLILDRIFNYRDSRRHVPDDFGVRLTAANVEAHIATADADLAAWSQADAELAGPILRAARTLEGVNNESLATCW